MPRGDRTEGVQKSRARTEVRSGPPKLLLWCAGAALILCGIALFCYALLSQGFLDAVFYIVVVAMGVYILLIPWRNRRAAEREHSSDEK